MKQILLKKGIASLVDINEPSFDDNEVKVRVHFSCVSIGTEISSKNNDKISLIKKIVSKPKLLSTAFELVKHKSLMHVLFKLKEKNLEYKAYGYSASGIVIAVGSKIKNLKVGDNVACAGGGFAFHAEVIVVPENLTVKLSENFPMAFASTVSIGSIALQGVRRLNPTYGECILVIGLGLIGQITCQILKNNGCRVVGIDLNKERLDVAKKHGIWKVLLPNEISNYEAIVQEKYPFGVDGVIITASSSSDDILNNAFKACRKKARVIVVGDVGMDIDRNNIYEKELDIKISTSYGPGRYEHKYENLGLDFPISYVRWTEKRNMEEYLDSIFEGKIKLNGLADEIIDVNESKNIIEEKLSNSMNFFTLIYNFKNLLHKDVPLSQDNNYAQSLSIEISQKIEKVKAAIIGTGGFFKNTALNVLRLNKDLVIVDLISKNGLSALNIKNIYELNVQTGTDIEAAMSNTETNTIFIYTKHNLHSKLILNALKCNKNVFCEKPLAINKVELDSIQKFYSESNVNKPKLLVGFNRRFSSHVKILKEKLKLRSSPLSINIRVNALRIPYNNWVHSELGGGRNIGEACHFYDLVSYIADSDIVDVGATSIFNSVSTEISSDNFIVILKFADGSIANINYSSQGSHLLAKEYIEVFFDDKTFIIDDFRISKFFFQDKIDVYKTKNQDKGHANILNQFIQDLKEDKWTIPLDQQIKATQVSFEVENLI